MSKTKARPLFAWTAARPHVAAEMDRIGMKRSQLADAAGLPRMTVYQAFDEGRSGQILVETLDAILRGIGRDLNWLIRRMKPQPR